MYLYNFLACIGIVFLAVIGRVLGEDAKIFIPQMSEWLITRAAKQLHEAKRSRFLEEWLAHNSEVETLSGKFVHAASIYIVGARRVGRIVGFRSGNYEIYLPKKRVFDVAVVVLFAPLWVPVLAITAIIVAKDGNAPFYAQRRIGQNGREFTVFKLRTMVPNADEILADRLAENPDLAAEWNRCQKLAYDPRITKPGRFLRKIGLDGIPALLAVLQGHMSIVGPSPHMPFQPPSDIGGNTLRMKPGLIGYWQVSGRESANMIDRRRLDDEYYRTASITADLKTIFKHLKNILTGYFP